MHAELPLDATRARWLTRAAAAQAVPRERELHRPLPLPGPRLCPRAPQHRLRPGVPLQKRGYHTSLKNAGLPCGDDGGFVWICFVWTPLMMRIHSAVGGVRFRRGHVRARPHAAWARGKLRGGRPAIRCAQRPTVSALRRQRIRQRGSLVLILIPVSFSFSFSFSFLSRCRCRSCSCLVLVLFRRTCASESQAFLETRQGAPEPSRCRGVCEPALLLCDPTLRLRGRRARDPPRRRDAIGVEPHGARPALVPKWARLAPRPHNTSFFHPHQRVQPVTVVVR
jgi:hypothetical protein